MPLISLFICLPHFCDSNPLQLTMQETKLHGSFRRTKQNKSINPNGTVIMWLSMITFIFWFIAIITYLQLPSFAKPVAASSEELVMDKQMPSQYESHRIGQGMCLHWKLHKNISKIKQQKYKKEQLKIHRVQSNNNNNWSNQREQVKETFNKAWNDYKSICFGQDELFPNGKRCRNWIGLGLTIIDAIDTMYIMNYNYDEFNVAKEFISNTLNFNKNVSVSFFETIIRCIGTMITLFDFTNDELYLNHLRILMDNLLPAFNTDGLGFPASDINLLTGDIHISNCDGKCVVFADIASIQLEFNAACDRLKDYKYCAKSDHVINMIDPNHFEYSLIGEQIIAGHYPIMIGLDGTFASNIYRWGAMGDSFYEYLLKLWIYEEFSRKLKAKQFGYFYDENRAKQYKRMYITAVDTMLETLYKKNEYSNLYYIAEIDKNNFLAKMDELACFVGGNLALASYRNITGDSKKSEKYLNAAIELTETCYQMWHETKSGLAPEYVIFSKNGMHPGGGADYYLLRPETVESLFYLYRITNNEKYRKYGYEIYESIERNCRIDNKKGKGYVPIDKVNSNKARPFKSGLDHVMVMHSFFLSETLKYLYLLFSDEQLIPLDKYVFNTEAHPILL